MPVGIRLWRVYVGGILGLRLSRTTAGWWVETEEGRGVAVQASDRLSCRDDLFEWRQARAARGAEVSECDLNPGIGLSLCLFSLS